MPVVLNTTTGFVEDLPQQAADAALQGGSHELPLVDPTGAPVSVPLSDAQQFIQQGYTQPSPEQLQSLLDHAEFSQTSEVAKTFAEGAAKAATFGLSTGLETGLGISTPERIRKRSEANPTSETAGEVAGLLGSSVLPGGALGVLGEAGNAVKAATGLGQVGSGLLSRTAAQAIKGAVEGALVQSGNEVSKMFVSDPEQSAETVLSNIGLAAALGGGTGAALEGAIAPAARSIPDSQLGQFIGALKNKALTAEEQTLATNAMKQAGMDIPAEIKGAIGSERGKALGQSLGESDTHGGKAYREAVATTYTKASDDALAALGRTREDIGTAPSAFESGQNVTEKLQKALQERSKPLGQQFDEIKGKFATAELDQGVHTDITERLTKLATEEGYALSESSAGLKEINRVMKDLPNLRTLEDLRKYQAVARENAMASNVPGLARKVGGVLREAEEGLVEAKLASKHPELLEGHRAARAEYRNLMDQIDSLNDRLHVGKYYGPDSFVKALGEMKPEQVLSRLGNMKDAGLLDTLSSQYPEVAQAVRDFHINSAIARLPHGDPNKLNINKMLKAIDGWTPELKKFTLSEPALDQLKSVKAVLDALPDRLNPSGTARTIDGLLKHIPGGIGAIIGGMFGHGPMGFLLGHASRVIGRELPDQGKLAILRALGTDGPVNIPAFKAMVKATEALHKADTAIRAGVANVFKGDARVLATSAMPSAADRRKLDNQLKMAQEDPNKILQSVEHDAHYMPEQAAATGAALTRATQYLNSLRPDTKSLSPLGPKRVPTDIEKAQYDRALDVAENPLVVLQHVKDGSLTQQDIHTISLIHPKLYQSLQDKLMSEAISTHEKGKIIPYRTLQSLSAFVGSPLDQALQPQNIALNQMKTGPGAQPQQSQPPSKPQALNKLPGMAATPAQAREQSKIGR